MATTHPGFLRQLRRLVADPEVSATTDAQLLERFRGGRDEAAFAALVRRHSGLVLGVCRRLLGDAHDAEDAFQATFLVLAQKSGSVRGQASVGSWLYRVAYRVSLRARRRSANRRKREGRAAVSRADDLLADVTGRELLAVLDEELQRLPGNERAALVLCYLEGRTRDDAARLLGCSESTLNRRIDRAKDRLRSRLLRRGVALPAALLALGLTQPAKAGAPAAWVAAAARAAGEAARGGLAGTSAGALAEETLRGMAGVKLRATLAALLVAGVLALGTGAFPQPAPPRRPAEEAQLPPPPAPPRVQVRAAATPSPAVSEKKTAFAGRVLGASGRPVAGARVGVLAYLSGRFVVYRGGGDDQKTVADVETDRDGRYRLELSLPVDEPYFLHLRAVAKGHGLGAQMIDSAKARPDTDIRLGKEHVARGRLINIEGAPAAGVPLGVRLPNYGHVPAGGPWPGPLTTDDKGRFTLRGLGLGTRVLLDVQDDRYVRQRLALEVGGGKPGEEPALTLAPLRVIEGQVTQEDTGMPVPGAHVIVETHQSYQLAGTVEARADERGRYRIIPYNGKDLTVRVFAPDGVPYLPREEQFAWPGAVQKHAVDFRLPRGVLVRGTVTEAGSGRPVAGAVVSFRPRRRDNRFYRREVIGFFAQHNEVSAAADGSFRIAVLPGPGHLLVKAPTADFLHVETSYHALESGKPGGQRCYPDALLPLDLKPGAAPTVVAVRLRRGVTIRGRVLDPEGKPANGVAMCRSYLPFGLFFGHNILIVRDGTFRLPGHDPDRPARVYFLDADRQRGEVLDLPAGGPKGGEVTVRLAPCGSARVRFVDEKGQPWANQPVGSGALFAHLMLVVTPGTTVWSMPWAEPLQSDAAMMVNFDTARYHALKTDAEGRVTFPTLIPGSTLHLMTSEGLGTVKKEFTAPNGGVVDLGDVPVRRGPG
jgi:RNA polymerase sigma factor (sigma-70 family)